MTEIRRRNMLSSYDARLTLRIPSVFLKTESEELQERGEAMSIPQDPVMLLSYVNTQLRDHYASLDDLCSSLDIDKEALIEKLKMIDYEYDTQRNAFV